MATAGENYIGLYCPACGKGLREVYEGVERLAECIRGHRWHVVAEGGKITFRKVEKPKEKPAGPTAFCEHGEYGG